MLSTACALAEAAERLGWHGDVVGPIDFGGARFWAVVDVGGAPDLLAQRNSVQLVGCFFVGTAGTAITEEASLLAAYSPRAVLVADTDDVTDLMMEAAILDQGVVVRGPSTVEVLVSPGLRVASGPTGPRENRLLDRVYEAWRRRPRSLVGAAVTPTQ